MARDRHTIERGDNRVSQHMIERGERPIDTGGASGVSRYTVDHTDDRATRHSIERGDGRKQPAVAETAEPPVGDLIRQLATDSSTLVRNELALAKLEMRDMARQIALDAGKLFGALTLVMAGMLALLAAAIVALGNALDGNYALSALIIGVVILVIGGLLARGGIAGLKRGHTPEQTVATLRSTRDWASDEIRDFKEEIRS